MKLSIIIPMLNEAAEISHTLKRLRPSISDNMEIIVVDGGSKDKSTELAYPHADRVLICNPGRATQMNYGANHARGEFLLFLHADTCVPKKAFDSLQRCLARSDIWGRFDVKLSGCQPFLRVVETCINWRSRWTGIATGDQGIFVKSDVFRRLGGFPDIPLMEDIELSKNLKRISKPICISEQIVTSSRRWENNGIMRTVLLMWFLRARYSLGSDPISLAKYYI